jgi:pimeloyl-ACP methyl ester carboxylesterase
MSEQGRALAQLTFDELGRAATGIGGVQRAVADRTFQVIGPTARIIQWTYGRVSDGVDAGIRGGAGLIGRGAGAAVGRLPQRPDRPTLSTSVPGSALLAAINGLIGNELEREGNALHEPMAVRVGGVPVAPETSALAAAFPEATPRLVVFVHGLMSSEFAWRLGAGELGETYGSRLARELGCTPVYLRYNSGRHVSENGRSLADLLAELHDAWPVEVEEIALVGHSMGGLVARSACHQAALEEASWVKRVRHVVSLGTPHMGAPLEQGAHYLSAALNRLPETRPFGAFLRRRSSGIRDLRQGSLVDEDWRDLDRDALRVVACQEVPLLEGATHCFVAATITRSESHPVARLIGDWLVLAPSASGRSRTRLIPFEADYGVHVGRTNHLALLDHPQVYERLRAWLSESP